MEYSDTLSRTSELGSLIARSNDESQFVGSSSGVFFVNTVRQAFAKSLGSLEASPNPEFPAPEDTIVGPPKSPRVKQDASRSRATAESRRQWTYDPHLAHLLGEAPALNDARQLMVMYFKLWHPLFPFLHGPSFLQAMEAFYSESSVIDSEFTSTMSEHRRACWTTILQCVYNISSLLQPDLQLAQKSKIASAANALKLVDVLLNRHDILSLQALLGLQLYLVGTMSLRNASLLGGAILRSILHAGFHRCPYRYQQLNSHDCQLRKRIFWCFYAIDRYLSQALGLPLGIQDSDIDVCLPGVDECHIPGNSSLAQSASPSQVEGSAESVTNNDIQDNSSQRMNSISTKFSQDKLNREATLAGYVMHGKLIGRALELFHKTLQNREVRRSAVLYLVSDVHKWWNNLPSSLQHGIAEQGANDNDLNADSNEESPFDLSPFFSTLYEHLILCINRPGLSLDPSSPEFCSSLQICISSARNILSLLKTQLAKGQPLFWPGLLSAAYMAGLVIAFACQLGQYSLFKGCQEISDCCNILQVMCRQWEIAKHCHRALSFLLLNIQRQSRDQDKSSTNGIRLKRINQSAVNTASEENKRRKTMGIVPGQDDSTTYQDQQNSSSFIDSAATQQNDTSQPSHEPNDLPSSIINEPLQSTEQEQPTTARNFDNTNGSNINASQDHQQRSPTMPDMNELVEDLQWPDESSSSFLTTNFDLNMTDLFQNSYWDPMLFDALTQGQMSPR